MMYIQGGGARFGVVELGLGGLDTKLTSLSEPTLTPNH